MLHGQAADSLESTKYFERLLRHETIVCILFLIWLVYMFGYIVYYTLFNTSNNILDVRIKNRYIAWDMFSNVDKNLFE